LFLLTNALSSYEVRSIVIASDEFVVIVPHDGLPFVADPGADLSEYVGSHFRVNKTVVLKHGRSLAGSVFRAREMTAGDELYILELLNQRFAR
jgi:hypothetical protein